MSEAETETRCPHAEDGKHEWHRYPSIKGQRITAKEQAELGAFGWETGLFCVHCQAPKQ